MTDESAQKRWTRRGLLGGAFASALAAGGLTFGGFSFASEKAERLPAEADVVVVGSGIAGLSAAVAAREAGAKRVLLLEKGPLAGGHSIYSSGSISVVSRKLQGRRDFRIRRRFLPGIPTPSATTAGTLRFWKESEQSRNLRFDGSLPWACGSAASSRREPKRGLGAYRATGIPRAEATCSLS